MTPQEAKRLKAIFKAFRELRPSMRLDMAIAIIEVSQAQGISGQDLVHRLDINKASASRLLLALEKIEKPGVEGLDMVEQRVDPNDRRNKLWYPNNRMKAFIKKLDSIGKG